VTVSLSFGLNHKINPHEQLELLHNFVAYPAIVMVDDQALLSRYIPSDLPAESENADGRAFGKPVWDFQYPESSVFVTKNRFVRCAIAETQPGDRVFVALGSTYPIILRPKDNGRHQKRYAIWWFAYVDGVMSGEYEDTESVTYQIE
jgi:hypothetical protein